MHGAEAGLDRRAPRTADCGCRILGCQRDRLFRKGPEDRIQIEVLMRGERSGRRGVRRRDCDHRRPIEKRVRDAEREIHGARSQRRYADSWPPRELAGGVGHQRGHRFVAREDELDAGLPGGLEKIEHLAAR